eukprot:TRINITY_DN2504_c0_g1_i1.p1 TRINITY_DN2504_c0_g1~~TRINITY_DN2504_c0_g1_i1.p1  ORF type:complete len:152 (-),score=38.68 TRINITY_DN2504_c0_g1_i1:30-461(-)
MEDPRDKPPMEEDPNQSDDDEEDEEEEDEEDDVTPNMLLQMAMAGDTAVLQACIENGSNIHTADHLGLTLLHWAACNGHDATVRMLLQSGADAARKNSWGETALQIAVRKKHDRVILVFDPTAQPSPAADAAAPTTPAAPAPQ